MYPGDIEFPVMLLGQIAATAQAVDLAVMARRGFTLTDVLELLLAHGHGRVDALASAWAAARPDDDAVGESSEPVVSEGEVAVVAGLLTDDLDWLPRQCSHPERAAAALAWLTRHAGELTVRHSPHALILGAVLWVTGDHRQVGVPACLTLSALAAAQGVDRRITGDHAAAARLSRRAGCGRC